MSEKLRMLAGELYLSNDEQLTKERNYAAKLIDEFNNSKYDESALRVKILNNLFGGAGKNIEINRPFYCDYGCNITVGDNFFANYNCIFLDVNKIIIGNNVLLAPNVSLYTATHPTDATIRSENLEMGYPIIIKDNVWIGGNVVVNPGVTIGENSIIGSGSVVTKNIPDNVIAVGNPCKVYRKITEVDKIYWKNKKHNRLKK